MSSGEEDYRPVKQVMVREQRDDLLGITKVTHNGRPEGKRTPQVNVPARAVEALGASIGDRIVWFEDADGVAFFRVSEKKWEDFTEAIEDGGGADD